MESHFKIADPLNASQSILSLDNVLRATHIRMSAKMLSCPFSSHRSCFWNDPAYSKKMIFRIMITCIPRRLCIQLQRDDWADLGECVGMVLQSEGGSRVGPWAGYFPNYGATHRSTNRITCFKRFLNLHRRCKTDWSFVKQLQKLLTVLRVSCGFIHLTICLMIIFLYTS